MMKLLKPRDKLTQRDTGHAPYSSQGVQDASSDLEVREGVVG